MPRLACYAVFLLITGQLFGHKSIAADRPNVLLICVDDLKPIAGCYGGTAQTPHIDRLAERGIRFDRAYCNQAVCSPSRNSLLTGFRPQTLGIYDLGTNFRKSRPDAVTLPQAFLKAGYHTEAMGKIFHVGHGNSEDAASWSVPHWKARVVAYHLPESKAPEGLTREEALFSNRPAKDLPRGAAYEAADVDDHAYPDGALADEVVRRLKVKVGPPGQPFFMAVGFVKPHLPFCAPKKYWDLYERSRFEVEEIRTAPAGAPMFAPTNWGELRQYKDMPEKGELTAEQERTLIHGYHAATSFMDAQLGKVVDCLDQTGLAENTIIIFWGDHGWHLGDHGMWCKHTNYEEAARIPLIIAAPDVAAGQTSKSFIETVDIYPTVCEMAGLSAPTDLDGKPFNTILKNPESSLRDYVVHVFPRGERLGRAVRTDRYRLVEWKAIGAPVEDAILELYDYHTDPKESRNLVQEQPDVVASLQKLMLAQPEPIRQIRAVPAPSQLSDSDKPKPDRGKMFDRRDIDHDGQLTLEEFLRDQPDPDKAPARFLKFDTNKDDVLSREEFVTQGKTAVP